MAKTLRQFRELYEPKAADEKKFVDKHVVKKNKDQNGNDDKLFNASNIKPTKRALAHGYETKGEHDDEKVYEEVQVDEKMHVKSAEMGDVIKDFKKSKAPQFKGKSQEKRRQMAIAAKLGAMREETGRVDEIVTPPEKAKQANDAMKKAATERADAEKARMQRARDLAKKALGKAKKLKPGESFSASMRKVSEDIDYGAVRDYLRAVYEGKLDNEEQQTLNEMLETEEGTKIAFIVTYFSGE